MAQTQQRHKEPRGLSRFVNLVLLAAAGYFATLTFLAPPPATVHSVKAALLSYAVPIVSSLMMLGLMRASLPTRVSIGLGLLLLCAVLVPVELYLSAPSRLIQRQSPLVVDSWRIRAQGVRAYPTLLPSFSSFGRRGFGRDPLPIPLAYISNELTFLCNKDAHRRNGHLVFVSDANGFRNARSEVPGSPLGVALVGDSYTQGECVKWNETLTGRIAATYPSTRNFGLSGAGPLWELGVFREYVARLRPRVSVWIYFEGNDLEDITHEAGSLMREYLDPGYTQNLLSKQPLLDASMRQHIDSLYHDVESRPLRVRIRNLLLLREFRHKLRLRANATLQTDWNPPETQASAAELVQVARNAVETASRQAATWNGKILFVYLPEQERYDSSIPRDRAREIREHELGYPLVIQAIRSLDIPVLDMVPVFAATKDPTAFWAQLEGHFNPQGYALVADSITAAIGRMQ